MKTIILVIGLFANQWLFAIKYDLKIENKKFDTELTIDGKKNVLIKNCDFSNKSGKFGLQLLNCENVLVEDCRIVGVGNESLSDYFVNLLPTDSTDFALSKGHYKAVALNLYNCKNVVIQKTEISDVFGQGIKVSGDNSSNVSEIVIDKCRIVYTYDDAIKIEVKDDQSDFNNVLPPKGVVIRNNLIHDIGLGLTQLPYARHGMYVKSRDALIEGNTIYNCFYGEGISLRNAGIVRNNKVWNCFIGCIGFWAQTNTEGSSKTVIIENNICRQDFNMNLLMRHIYVPKNEPVVKANIIQWAFYDTYRAIAAIDKFIVRNNTCIAGADFRATHAMIVSFEQPRKEQQFIYEANKMIDISAQNKYYINTPAMKNEVKRF